MTAPDAPSLRARVVATLQARDAYARWVLLAALAGMFANTFPYTILAVSLGVIAQELGSSETTLAWVITGPMLFSALALPVLGKLGDLYGHRRVFLLGSAGAAVTAVWTAYAPDALSLIALRTLTAVLGATTQPSSMALIFSSYPVEGRTRAMGWWSMTGAAAPALGLVAGGPLVELLGWRVLFVIQAVFAFLALGLAWLVLTETARERVRFDVPGAATLSLAVGALVFGLSRLRGLDALLGVSGACLALGGVGLAAFVAVERRAREPLLPLEFFRRAGFTAPMLASATMGAAYMGAFVLSPLVLRQVFAFSISATAFAMLLRTLTLSVASPVGGYLGQRHGKRMASVLGTALIALAMALLAVGTAATSLALFGVGLLLQGLGQGLCMPSLDAALAESVPERHLGIATAAYRLVSQVATAFGIAFMTMLYAGEREGFYTAFAAGVALAAASTAAAALVPRVSPPEHRDG